MCMLALFTSTHAKEIHVSKQGNDTQAGTQNAPYKTIYKASQVAEAGDVVIIHEGVYEETLTPKNSGTAGAPIVFKGADGEKVVISAMQALSGWQLDKGVVYKTTVDWDLDQSNMVFNGATIMDLARWPNNTDGNAHTHNGLPNSGGSNGQTDKNSFLTYNEGIPNYDWSKGGSIFFYNTRAGWLAWKAWVKSNDTKRINFDFDKGGSWIQTEHAPDGKGFFYLEGIKEAIDYKNEWYFDSSTKTLFVQMPEGAKPTDGQVQMRKRLVTVDLNNKKYIEIRNLAVTGGEIKVTGNAENNLIYGVTSTYGNNFRGVMKGAISYKQSISLYGKNNKVEKTEVAYGSANGIFIAGDGNSVINSHVHHFNTLGSYDAVLHMRGGKNTTIKNNVLSHGGRDVVQAFNKVVDFSYNDVSYSNLIANDCGLFYTVGGPWDMKVHHNWFHDAYAQPGMYKAAGIYLDNDAANFDVYNNVVWNTSWTSVQINWNGTNINIYNNTLVKNKATMGAWHKDGTAFSNVKVWNNITDKQGTSANGQEDEATWEPQSDKQNNLISKESFKDYEANDFTLKANSPAVDYGREISSITNGYKGTKPDVGAYELGNTAWKPGVDWNLKQGPDGEGAYSIPGESHFEPEKKEPYKTAISLPGKIEAENYDKGGEGVSYSDIDPLNKLGAYRNDGVDIEAITGGYSVGWIADGEWLEYTVNVTEDGDYKFNFSTSAYEAKGEIEILVDGKSVLDGIETPITADWKKYVITTSDAVALKKGEHIVRVNIVKGLFNLDYINVTKEATVNPPVEPEDTTTVDPTPEPEDTTTVKPPVEPEDTTTVDPTPEPEDTTTVKPPVNPEDTIPESVIVPTNPEKIRVFPNPVKTFVNVNTDLDGEIMLMLPNERKVMSLKRGKNLIGNLPKGVYFIVIEEDGEIESATPIYKLK